MSPQLQETEKRRQQEVPTIDFTLNLKAFADEHRRGYVLDLGAKPKQQPWSPRTRRVTRQQAKQPISRKDELSNIYGLGHSPLWALLLPERSIGKQVTRHYIGYWPAG